MLYGPIVVDYSKNVFVYLCLAHDRLANHLSFTQDLAKCVLHGTGFTTINNVHSVCL